MISKNYVLDNGATTTFHVMRRVEVLAPFDHATVRVHSFANEEAFLAGAGHLWNNEVRVPLAPLSGPLADAIEAWLITDPISPFAGGTLAADQSETLESAKTRAVARITRCRDAAEVAPFAFNGEMFDSDQRRVTGTTLAALIAQLNNAPFQINFTRADRTVAALNASQAIDLGLTLLAHVNGVFDTARDLFDQIEAAQTSVALDAIAWPA